MKKKRFFCVYLLAFYRYILFSTTFEIFNGSFHRIYIYKQTHNAHIYVSVGQLFAPIFTQKYENWNGSVQLNRF